jgi:hypothetical protein
VFSGILILFWVFSVHTFLKKYLEEAQILIFPAFDLYSPSRDFGGIFDLYSPRNQKKGI